MAGTNFNRARSNHYSFTTQQDQHWAPVLPEPWLIGNQGPPFPFSSTWITANTNTSSATGITYNPTAVSHAYISHGLDTTFTSIRRYAWGEPYWNYQLNGSSSYYATALVAGGLKLTSTDGGNYFTEGGIWAYHKLSEPLDVVVKMNATLLDSSESEMGLFIRKTLDANSNTVSGTNFTIFADVQDYNILANTGASSSLTSVGSVPHGTPLYHYFRLRFNPALTNSPISIYTVDDPEGNTNYPIHIASWRLAYSGYLTNIKPHTGYYLGFYASSQDNAALSATQATIEYIQQVPTVGFTYNPVALSRYLIAVSAAQTATGRTYNPSIAINQLLSVSTARATGFTYSPSFGLSEYITANVSSGTGVTYTPTLNITNGTVWLTRKDIKIVFI